DGVPDRDQRARVERRGVERELAEQDVEREPDREVEDDADHRCGDGRPRRASMYGAPRKIHRKQGAKVTQVVRSAPMVPARSGAMPAGGWLYAPRKPTNCTTMMSGPGVVSASPRPSTICCGPSQPKRATACCAT